MRLMSNAVSIGIRKSRPEAGSWGGGIQLGRDSMSFRDRVGIEASETFGTLGYMPGSAGNGRILTPAQLHEVYVRTPDVRSCVEKIARRVATWDWICRPDVKTTHRSYKAILAECERITKFLREPVQDSEINTWQELCTAFVADVLVHESGAVEMVYGTRDKEERRPDWAGGRKVQVPKAGARILELAPLAGAAILPVQDAYGRTLGYVQDVLGILAQISPLTIRALDVSGARNMPLFSPDQICRFRLFPSTAGAAVPIIETIWTQVQSILAADDSIKRLNDADEIPPGILVLAGISGENAKAAREDFKNLRAQREKIRVMTTPDPKGVGASWVSLAHTPREIQIEVLVREIRRAIWRGFGVLPIEQGDTQEMPRAVGAVQLEVGSSHLINPLLEVIEARVNAKVIRCFAAPRFHGLIRWEFDRETRLTPGEQEQKTKALIPLLDRGVLNINEVRAELDREPIDGGDVYMHADRTDAQDVDKDGDGADEGDDDGADEGDESADEGDDGEDDAG